MKVVSFELEESKVNKGCMCLVATCEDGKKYVMSGGHEALTYMQPYETNWDTKENNPYAFKK